MSNIKIIFICSGLITASFVLSFIFMGGDSVKQYFTVLKYHQLHKELSLFLQKALPYRALAAQRRPKAGPMLLTSDQRRADAGPPRHADRIQPLTTRELKNEAPKNDKPKLILPWKGIHLQVKVSNFDGCPFDNCKSTLNRSQINDSDAVIFSGRWPVEFPSYRPKDQIWIYQIQESQLRSLTGKSLQHFNGKINYTFTFMVKSDISDAYGYFKKRDVILPHDVKEREKRAQKTKFVAWLVTNCHTQSKREVYFQRLSQYIEADKFGRCSGKTRRCHGNCLENITREYKFYFAAENSICKDYITEKVYRNSLTMGMVPIVYGGANYSHLLPHKSYIDVRDFASPKDLAEYLKKIASDEDLYNEYFAWKREYEVIVGRSECNLCEFMHRKDKPPKVYEDITKFWTPSDCISGDAYLKTVSHGN